MVHNDNPAKDDDQPHPVASEWRHTIREIVDALAAGDYWISRQIKSVAPVTVVTAEQIKRYLQDYGETLTQLPDDAWASSVSQWTGTHWDVFIDLWTAESGRSDLVLDLRVFQSTDGFRFELHAVYVP